MHGAPVGIIFHVTVFVPRLSTFPTFWAQMLRHGLAGINTVDDFPLERNIFVQSGVLFFSPKHIS